MHCPVFFIADRTIAAAVAIAALLLITGAHHFDGLLDLGDGLMAHGDREKRISALTDRQVGAGGVAAGIAVTLLLFAGLMASSSIIIAVIIGEVCAKFSMAFLTAYGTPFREGIHSYLHTFSKPYLPVHCSAFLHTACFSSGFACSDLPELPLRWLYARQFSLLFLKELFGGVNGDIVGASNEITRACVILIIALI